VIKQTPSTGRMIAMIAFTASCVGILLFLWLSFGGSIPLRPESYRVTVVVPEATTLVEEADVRLAGVNIGKVKKRSLDKGAARTRVELEIKSKYAPIPRDTKAIMRQKTLLGEAFVELSPGNPKSGKLEDGSQLNVKNVESTTELDEIFRVFDPPTRRAFRRWVQEGSTVVSGNYPQDFNDVLGNLAPFATDGSKLLQILDDQEIAVRRTIKHTGRVFNALAAEEGQLQGLITNGNETFQALASRDEALSQTFEVLPTFERETRTTLRRLDRFAANTRPLVNDLKGPADDLGPTVRDLGRLAPHLTRTLKDFNPLIRASRRGLPAATRTIRGLNPVVDATHTLIPELSPVLADLSFNAPSVARFLSTGGGALGADGSMSYADNIKANEHRLPQIATIDSQSFRQLDSSRPPDDRGNTYVAPNAYRRAAPLGTLESGDCDNVGGGQRDPKDGDVQDLGALSTSLNLPILAPLAGTLLGTLGETFPVQSNSSPPCFVQPPSLFQNQQFPKLERGKVEIENPPLGLQGTRPATP
jgi:phospholipid/cholesterol/gamma-HCH transport system substrate-binding protein